MQLSNTTNMYQYKAFGLKIASDIELPELHRANGCVADVVIIHGTAPGTIEEPLEENNYYQVAEKIFLFWVEGVARYCVKQGREVVVEAYHDADPKEIRLYLLGTAMGVLLLQRGIIPLHGSAIIREGHCVVFTGQCGAGKSTLANALYKKGAMLLADDVAAVHVDRNRSPYVVPAYPRQKLWQDSADMMNIDIAGLDRVCKNMSKYNVPVDNGFGDIPRILNVIYELQVSSGGKVAITPLNGIEKLRTVLNHTYRAWLIGEMGIQAAHFAKCAAIVETVPVFRITRPDGTMSLGKIVDVFEQHFTKLCKSKQVIM